MLCHIMVVDICSIFKGSFVAPLPAFWPSGYEIGYVWKSLNRAVKPNMYNCHMVNFHVTSLTAQTQNLAIELSYQC